MFIQINETPNPQTLKFVVDRKIVNKGSYTFEKSANITNAPIVTEIFHIEGIDRVFLTEDFFAITKSEECGWDMLKHDVLAVLNDYLTKHDQVIIEEVKDDTKRISIDDKDITNIEKEIMEIIETKIRPAVAEDGGDVSFIRFKEGVVYLEMQGACSGCPSATYTLKNGIERMMKHYIPEVQAVESI